MPTKEEMLNSIERRINAEKVQKELSNKVSEISALSSGDIRKYEFLTNKDILPSSTEMIIQEKKFDYTPLGKKLDTQTEKLQSIKETGEKQVDTIKENQLVLADKLDKNSGIINARIVNNQINTQINNIKNEFKDDKIVLNTMEWIEKEKNEIQK